MNDHIDQKNYVTKEDKIPIQGTEKFEGWCCVCACVCA